MSSTLVVPVATLPAEGRTFPLDLDVEEVNRSIGGAGVGGLHAVDALTGEARVMASGGDAFVLGRFRTRVAYRCSRCLEPFERDVAGEFHLVYTARDVAGTGEVELHREDLDAEPLEGGAVDLARAALEQLHLALEAFPVCREECRGLCPECGADLNEGPCACPALGSDPRLAALAKWSGGGNG